jgi:exopolysaccharide biosynthesis predicted pyruvyltransferase EpsI
MDLNFNKKAFSNIIKSYHTSDIYFITGRGNTGDALIYEGTRTLLKSLNIEYKEIDIFDSINHHGGLALICGGGAWCNNYHEIMPFQLSVVENNFKNVIVLPSSYEVSVDAVRDALSGSKALFMAREQKSYEQIKNICNTKLMHDHAFYFDYSAYIKEGVGTLNAFRTDKEKEVTTPIPSDNIDISALLTSLPEWLNMISAHEIINTDRAHVMIAGAMMGKKVCYVSSNYHKVPEIAKFSLNEYQVYLIEK